MVVADEHPMLQASIPAPLLAPVGRSQATSLPFPFKSNSGNETAQENSVGASGSSRKQLDLHRAIKK